MVVPEAELGPLPRGPPLWWVNSEGDGRVESRSRSRSAFGGG